MPLVVPMDGQGSMLALIVNKRQPEDLVLKLFVNDLDPNRGHSSQDFVELEGFGYEPKTLPGDNWTIVEGDPSFAAYARQIFEFSGAVGEVFGYYIVQESGNLMWAERFPDAPFTIKNDGDEIKVTPRMELEMEKPKPAPRAARVLRQEK